MVGVIVDYKIVAAAIPAPLCGDTPICGSNDKRKAAGKPKAVSVKIKAFDAVTIGWAEPFKAAMFVGMI
jgi:hypothetical protein